MLLISWYYVNLLLSNINIRQGGGAEGSTLSGSLVGVSVVLERARETPIVGRGGKGVGPQCRQPDCPRGHFDAGGLVPLPCNLLGIKEPIRRAVSHPVLDWGCPTRGPTHRSSLYICIHAMRRNNVTREEGRNGTTLLFRRSMGRPKGVPNMLYVTMKSIRDRKNASEPTRLSLVTIHSLDWADCAPPFKGSGRASRLVGRTAKGPVVPETITHK